MAPFALNSQFPARKKLFSWTTKEQANSLRLTKVLLSKTLLDANDRSLFEFQLKNIANFNTAHRIALLLRKPPMNRRRYAFSNALGWSVGVAGKPYGDVLLRITLRDEAILLGIGSVAPQGLGGVEHQELLPFRAMTARGEAVPPVVLEQNPERIAAVFHEGTDIHGVRFREYILVNEGMIESWAVGTDDIVAELRTSREALDHLIKVSPEQGTNENQELPAVWQGSQTDWPHAPWTSVLGTSAPPYTWTKTNLERIRAQLNPDAQPAALEHHPKLAGATKLPALPPRPPPPPPRPKGPPIELY